MHCLISLGIEQTIEKVIQLIKGESSHWINKTGLCKTKFGWQDEYILPIRQNLIGLTHSPKNLMALCGGLVFKD
jgi:hypothetical protein